MKGRLFTHPLSSLAGLYAEAKWARGNTDADWAGGPGEEEAGGHCDGEDDAEAHHGQGHPVHTQGHWEDPDKEWGIGMLKLHVILWGLKLASTEKVNYLQTLMHGTGNQNLDSLSHHCHEFYDRYMYTLAVQRVCCTIYTHVHVHAQVYTVMYFLSHRTSQWLE